MAIYSSGDDIKLNIKSIGPSWCVNQNYWIDTLDLTDFNDIYA